ncbi:MAG: hypothetical protein IPL46_14715 [Saprospiraceae bacterium]|nr:hypothetical protein [Saprospiraceae bacterium]
MTQLIKIISISALLLNVVLTYAIVKYDEGNLTINGIQLFQDREVDQDFYYLPQYPKIATKSDGTLEFIFMKYVGSGGPAFNGGLFHTLVEFALTKEELSILETELRKKVPGARLRGPVPLQEALKDGEAGMASFKIISSILSSTSGESAFTNSVLTSGHAPFLPGSKAALATMLNQQGATLLWESFQSGTSDVSIALEGFFEAAIKGYNAIIEAEMDILYEHFSELSNNQGGFSRTQTRSIIDSLVQTQKIRIEVFDRSTGLDIKTDDMQKILDLITGQMINLMFDVQNGWARLPLQEKPADAEIRNRSSNGGLSGFLFGAGSEPYTQDNQYILKERKDIRSFKFYLNLSKSTTIKVPVYTSGNLSGIFNEPNQRDKYFRIVNLDDPDFQQREIHFQVDANYTEGFNDIINFVTVNFKKAYGVERQNETSDTSFLFSKKDLLQGIDLKSVHYPRLGITGMEWLNYDYQVSWSIKGRDQPLFFPSERNEWASSNLPSISLVPSFGKRVIEIDADRDYFREVGIKSATVRFFAILGGKPGLQKSLTLRVEDPINTNSTSIFFDENEPIAYQINWYGRAGEHQDDLKVLEGTYLFLVPPDSTLYKR